MKERTFASFAQYETFIRHKFIQKANAKGLEGDELAEYVSKHEQHAAEIWKEHDGDECISQQGFITLVVWKDEQGQRRIGRGRPKKAAAEKLNHSIHVRLDDVTYAKLNSYCQEKKIDLSEAIRHLIDTL
ncbi:hypothetical protein [Paenibacillus agricola]|uniref:Ribbon-helix-helix protein CopG domain-containing protein n=1 Tax=Paenibacillus agricola TaxID=2716264 RepID=A0ABX0JAM7_9BACL|nr:hypothetical protein [Paenibacillus agricola]NHN33449.1 hypothetical protein [Paenibacillus agricola]